jgi:hypothetical protein
LRSALRAGAAQAGEGAYSKEFVDVRFTQKATELLGGIETTRWAKSRRLKILAENSKSRWSACAANVDYWNRVL